VELFFVGTLTRSQSFWKTEALIAVPRFILKGARHTPNKKGREEKVERTGKHKPVGKTNRLYYGAQSNGTGHQAKIDKAVVTAHGQTAKPVLCGFSDESTDGGEGDGQTYTQKQSGE
jgi:hypothetical protein